MQIPQPQPGQLPASNGTETNSQAFVETIEYRRFVEFCDACRRFRYIGLCYGSPGIGKTLSALRYSRAEMIVRYDRWTSESSDQLPIDTVLYTTSVINTPSRVESDIRLARESIMGIAMRPLRREATAVLDEIRVRDEARRKEILNRPGCSPCDRPAVDPTYFQTFELYEARKKAVPDPTTLILVDEADRLQIAPEVMARLIRMTGGNFRLLTRLLTQIERVLNVNNLQLISSEVVEAARDSLVIGQN